MLLEQTVPIKWNGNNRVYYENKGYVFSKYNEVFEVNVFDLPRGSHSRVRAKCDYCGKEYDVFYYNYIKYTKMASKVACSDCRTTKSGDILLSKYGSKSPRLAPEAGKKAEQTCLEKYGVANTMLCATIKARQEQTNIEKYGGPSPFSSPDIQQKSKATIKEKYGVEYIMQNPEAAMKNKETVQRRYGVDNVAFVPAFVRKAKDTCRQRYGGESSQSSPEIRAKSWATMNSNGNIPTSGPELRMVTLLENIYGKQRCIPQFALDKICFDCLLVLDAIKIDVEYDGWYWHKRKQNQDMRRDWYSMRRGYKVLRFVSNGQEPTAEDIINGVDYLVNNQAQKLVKYLDIQEEDIV